MFDASFREKVIQELSDVPVGYMERIDGLRCSKHLINDDFWFFRFRLRLMERAGLIRSKRTRSYWPSCDGMPAFCLTDAGRALLPTD